MGRVDQFREAEISNIPENVGGTGTDMVLLQVGTKLLTARKPAQVGQISGEPKPVQIEPVLDLFGNSSQPVGAVQSPT
jgi:hypothetical protein